MGFTIQDMITTSATQYQMTLAAGQNGWANSISWVLMIEDTAIINNFSGKELAVTTCLGFDTTSKLMDLAERLVKKHASGLILNTGEYLMEIPEELILFCQENDFPLIEVPWEIYLADMIKDLSIRIFLEGTADEKIAHALISAIENPSNPESYRKELLPYYDVDGTFQIVLFATNDLAEMDTVERRKLSHRLQIYLENITHNGNFFYYDSTFVLMMNDVSKKDCDEILSGMLERTRRRMPETPLFCGLGSITNGISNLHLSYKRAKAALLRALQTQDRFVEFDQMGMYRLLYMVDDPLLLSEMSNSLLAPVLAYDAKHESNYIETLESYLKNDGSIQAVAQETFTHRNTVIYRITNIKKLLGNDLSSMADKLQYAVALHINRMNTLYSKKSSVEK